MHFWESKKFVILAITALIVILSVAGYFGAVKLIKDNKKTVGIKSINAITKIAQFLPIPDDEKKELEVVNSLISELTKNDNQTRTFMIFLQNNMELRPGGGFLGQYAIVKIKNGEVTESFFEDANLLDQRITTKITPPYPFTRMMQIKKWKFRDSNFSPDFPTNVEKAQYFYRLSGRSGNFDGFVAVNAEVFNHILELTGPITVPGYNQTFTSRDGALKLEEFVEKRYIMNPELDTQNRKMIMKQMTPLLIEKLFSLRNISKIAELAHKELKNKNVMLNFKDPKLQQLVENVHWDGRVSSNWNDDYLMAVDANMGSLKTDYFMRREMSYELDLTAPKPTATLYIKYRNTATYGDWRTSDYHSYTRVYVPKGSTLLEREMVGAPITGEEFGKTYFGFIIHTVMGTETNARVKYELPADFPRDNYRLLIQKQSGVGNIPVKIKVGTDKGEYKQEQVLDNDLKFEFK